MIADRTQVTIRIFVKPQSVECPAEPGLQVAEHRINSAKFSHLIRMPSIHDYGRMRASHFSHSTKASQPVADYLTATAQGPLTPIGNGGKGEGLDPCHFHVQRVPRVIQRDRCYVLNIVFSTTTRLATIAFSS